MLKRSALVARHVHNFLFICTAFCLSRLPSHEVWPGVICMLYCPHKSANL